MPRRSPRDDGIVNWYTDPSKDQRLLDWLDTHETERDILFASERREGKNSVDPRFSLIACGTRAATAIFAYDSNVILRERVLEDPLHYGKVVTDHIRNRLKRKYQKFNQEIGPHATNLRYKDIKIGGKLHRKIDQLMSDEFPEWRRLHVYWRTNAYFNQYCSSSTRPSARLKEKKSRTSPASDVIIVDDDQSGDMESEDNIEEIKPPRQSFAESSRSSKVKIEPTDSLKTYNEQGNVPENTVLKSAQSHELRMEELRIERMKLDIQKTHLEAEACKRRVKHEMMLQLMAFVNGEVPEMNNIMMKKAHSI